MPAAALLHRRADAEDRTLTVVALGQAVIARDLREPPYPGFARLRDALAGADAGVVDLVAAIRGPHAGSPARGGPAVRAADAAVLDCLKSLGINLLALANNHSFDLNAGGLADLFEAARARDLTYAGAGADLAGANAAGYRTMPNGKVALVSVATGDIRANSVATDTRPGVNTIPRQATGDIDTLATERVASQVHAAGQNADLAIVYHHHEPHERDVRTGADWQQRVARRAIEFGAGMVIGAGVPQLKGIEIYRGRPIFYGLGSFVLQAPGELDAEALQSVAARCVFSGETLRRIELQPIQLSAGGPGESDEDSTRGESTRGRPTIPEPPAAAAILARLAELSRPYNTTIAVADGIGRIAL